MKKNILKKKISTFILNEGRVLCEELLFSKTKTVSFCFDLFEITLPVWGEGYLLKEEGIELEKSLSNPIQFALLWGKGQLEHMKERLNKEISLFILQILKKDKKIYLYIPPSLRAKFPKRGGFILQILKDLKKIKKMPLYSEEKISFLTQGAKCKAYTPCVSKRDFEKLGEIPNLNRRVLKFYSQENRPRSNSFVFFPELSEGFELEKRGFISLSEQGEIFRDVWGSKEFLFEERKINVRDFIEQGERFLTFPMFLHNLHLIVDDEMKVDEDVLYDLNKIIREILQLKNIPYSFLELNMNFELLDTANSSKFIEREELML